MRNIIISSIGLVCGLLLERSNIYGQERANTNSRLVGDAYPAENQINWLPGLAPTRAYQREALRIMIEEANLFALEMKLEENLPISISNLTGLYINPPAGFINHGILGTLATTNYEYCLTEGKTVSGIDRHNLVESWQQIKKDYWWPISRLDTNVAFQKAQQIMIKAGMDVPALNRDCRISIIASVPEGPAPDHFTPDYWVNWFIPGTNVAFLEFLEPTMSIRQLHVDDGKYILRKPREIPNLNQLLKETNAPSQTNVDAKAIPPTDASSPKTNHKRVSS